MLELQRLIPDSLLRLREVIDLDPVISRRDAALAALASGKLTQNFAASLRKLSLPAADRRSLSFGDLISVGSAEQLTEGQHALLEQLLRELIPWRTGPFAIFGHEIDAEWNSDIKWGRAKLRLPPLRGLRVLDVGCGNGYFMFRALADEPELIVGIDPVDRCLCQFMLLAAPTQSSRLAFLPLGIQEAGIFKGAFDLAFCFGVIYHQPDPIAALRELRKAIRPGGTLALETLVIDSLLPTALCPRERYLGMRNISFIPSPKGLENWLFQAGFTEIEAGEPAALSPLEQRKTRWAPNHSLSDFLDSSDPALTVEGYPAPRRIVVYAR